MNREKNRIKEYLSLIFLFAFAFLIMYICTASSPRYAANPWRDSNAFFTVGRAMASGLTVYKDIFEQKGPLLYLIHAIASLISDKSFTGVYIMESVCIGVTSFAVYKIASLYITGSLSVASAVLTCFAIANSVFFYTGDSAEEFCLPFLMISLYYFCRYFKNTEQYKIRKLTFFLIGFFAGCVAMIKFTLIGFWFAWAAYISLYVWIAKKDFKTAFINAMIFVGGMAAAIIPWVIYFLIKGALYDFMNVYFVINATAYPQMDSAEFDFLLLNQIFSMLRNMWADPVASIIGILGLALFLFTSIFTEKKLFSRLSVPFVGGFGIYIIFFGVRFYNYYIIPITAFSAFFFIALGALVSKIKKEKAKNVTSAVICAVAIIATPIVSNYCNLSSKYVTRRGNSTVQSEVASYIAEHNPDGKILNYSMLDDGFYLAAGQIPKFKHFEYQNLPYEKYPDNTDEQNRYIDNKEADYVIVAVSESASSEDKVYELNGTLKTDYRLVMKRSYSQRKHEFIADEIKQTCYLFELKEN